MDILRVGVFQSVEPEITNESTGLVHGSDQRFDLCKRRVIGLNEKLPRRIVGRDGEAGLAPAAPDSTPYVERRFNGIGNLTGSGELQRNHTDAGRIFGINFNVLNRRQNRILQRRTGAVHECPTALFTDEACDATGRYSARLTASPAAAEHLRQRVRHHLGVRVFEGDVLPVFLITSNIDQSNELVDARKLFLGGEHRQEIQSRVRDEARCV